MELTPTDQNMEKSVTPKGISDRALFNIIAEATSLHGAFRRDDIRYSRLLGALEGILMERGILQPGVPFEYRTLTKEHSFLGKKWKTSWKQSYSSFILDKANQLLLGNSYAE